MIPENKRAKVAHDIYQAGEIARAEAVQRGASRDVCENFSRIAAQDAEKIRENVLITSLDKWATVILENNVSILS